MAVEWCKPCRERGRLNLGHHDVAGTLMCDACFEGKPVSGLRSGLAAGIFGKKREDAAMEKCKCGREATHRGRCWVRRGLSGPVDPGKKGAGGGVSKALRPAKRGRRKSNSANREIGVPGVTLTATPELCDGIWAALPLEKKAALLNRLHEVN